jgi:hypothetical protein
MIEEPVLERLGPWPKVAGIALLAVLLALAPGPALAQEEQEESPKGGQDAETKALDSTATQWSFQFAYQVIPSYYDDTLDNGEMRPEGNTDYAQLRIVAPIPLKEFTILPRLTARHYENAQGQSGFGNTEIFALMVPGAWDWGSGRFGIGPLVTLPGDKEVNSKGKWFYGLLLTQSWRAVDPTIIPPGSSDTNPLGIVPIVNYRIAKGWYVGNGDMVARYDWDKNEFYLPIGIRVGKVFVLDKGTWNFYGEYQTSLLKNDWSGSAVKDSIRINATYTIPVM